MELEVLFLFFKALTISTKLLNGWFHTLEPLYNLKFMEMNHDLHKFGF